MVELFAIVSPVQTAAGLLLRGRVAGPDAESRARRIWDTPGERWFTPDDPIWRVHANAAMFPAGIGTLLLQSLHPSAMAGVAGHSGYRSDPWGRLQRTSHYLATTTFGTVQDAEAAIARVRRIHGRVRGVDSRGVPYDASDPHLLRWVHVAEVWCFLAAFQQYSGTPLTPEEADRYVDQTRTAASLLGATRLPRTVTDLDDALASYRPELVLTAGARDTRSMLLLHPQLPLPARPAYAALAVGAIALLPPWAVGGLGLRTGPLASLFRASGIASVRAVQWAMAGVDR